MRWLITSKKQVKSDTILVSLVVDFFISLIFLPTLLFHSNSSIKQITAGGGTLKYERIAKLIENLLSFKFIRDRDEGRGRHPHLYVCFFRCYPSNFLGMAEH